MSLDNKKRETPWKIYVHRLVILLVFGAVVNYRGEALPTARVRELGEKCAQKDADARLHGQGRHFVYSGYSTIPFFLNLGKWEKVRTFLANCVINKHEIIELKNGECCGKPGHIRALLFFLQTRMSHLLKRLR